MVTHMGGHTRNERSRKKEGEVNVDTYHTPAVASHKVDAVI